MGLRADSWKDFDCSLFRTFWTLENFDLSAFFELIPKLYLAKKTFNADIENQNEWLFEQSEDIDIFLEIKLYLALKYFNTNKHFWRESERFIN